MTTETIAAVDRSVHRLVREAAERNPSAVAVSWSGGQLTYRELVTRADTLAAALRARGVRPETCVAVAVPRSADFIVAALAVLTAGGAYVPVDPAYPTDRRAFMLADANAALMITADGSGTLTVASSAGALE